MEPVFLSSIYWKKVPSNFGGKVEVVGWPWDWRLVEVGYYGFDLS
jgi:hypothetical protein